MFAGHRGEDPSALRDGVSVPSEWVSRGDLGSRVEPEATAARGPVADDLFSPWIAQPLGVHLRRRAGRDMASGRRREVTDGTRGPTADAGTVAIGRHPETWVSVLASDDMDIRQGSGFCDAIWTW